MKGKGLIIPDRYLMLNDDAGLLKDAFEANKKKNKPESGIAI
jgi:hypothetical protein